MSAVGKWEDGEFGEYRAMAWAVEAAAESGCLKSQRGVVIWLPGDAAPRSIGFNHQPGSHECDGSAACRAACNKLCVHAEAHALLGQPRGHGLHLLHIKTVNGGPVPSGDPSCWQCSRLILASGRIAAVWLLRAGPGPRYLHRYSPDEFHRETLGNRGLPIIDGESDS